MQFWNNITVTSLHSILTVPSAKGRRLNIRNRMNYGLSFCKGDGKLVYTKDGKKYESTHDSAILLPMGQTYSLYCPEAGDFPLINFTASADFAVTEFVVCPLKNPDVYLRDYERLKEAFVHGERVRAFGIFYGILARLARESERLAHPRLAPVAELLSARCPDPDLTVSSLAEHAGISEVYFRRLFRETYGVSPKQYLLDLRLKHACQLLVEETANVTEIAERCGFSGVYHFCRAFKSNMGETPTEYRRKERF